MTDTRNVRDAVYRPLANLVSNAKASLAEAKADLQLHGRECPDCGVLRRPDEYGTTNQGKPQKICKSCKQRKGDESKAKRLGFGSVEEMREHYAAKRAARDREKVAKRYGKRSKRPYTPPPPQTPEDALKSRLQHIMLEALSTSLREYELMAELCADAAWTARYSNQTFGEHLRYHWFTHDDIKPYFLTISTKHNKRWSGGWPFQLGRSYKPPKPLRAGEFWP